MSDPRRWTAVSRAIDIASVAIAAALIVYGAYTYVSLERTLYSWDDANYSSITERFYRIVFPSDAPGSDWHILEGLKAVYGSFGAEYSLLFAVPIVIAERAFGHSREVFISAMALFWFVPYCVAWGLVSTCVFSFAARKAFWWTFVLGVALPLTWMSVMHGYSDAGASALMGVAVYLYLRDMDLKSAWRCVALGLVLCLLPLFRRHFVFAVIAFVGAMVLQHAWAIAIQARRTPREARRTAMRIAGRLTIVGAAAAAGLLTIGYPFVALVWSNDYFSLYSGWMVPATEMAAGLISAYGVVLSGACVLGYTHGLRLGILRQEPGLFLALIGLLNVLEWVIVVRQPGLQYLVHVSPFVVVGFMALMVAAARGLRSGHRAAALTGGVALVGYRLAVGFALIAPVDSPNPSGVYMATNPPQVRRDYGEIRRLVTDVREDARVGATVYVASSSWTLNADIFRRAEVRFFGIDFLRLRVPEPPDVDSRDWYPVQSLTKADYVLIALPTQYSLEQKEQQTVKLVTDAFEDNLPIARTFTPMPAVYVLENGATVRMFRREAPTDAETALQELSREEMVLKSRPGRQSDWLSLDFDPRTTVVSEANGTHRIVLSGPTPPTPHDAPASRRLFVYLGEARQRGARTVEASYALTGSWLNHHVSAVAWLADADSGAAIVTGPVLPLTAPSGRISIPIPARSAAGSRLVFELVTPESGATGAAPGTVTLSGLAVR